MGQARITTFFKKIPLCHQRVRWMFLRMFIMISRGHPQTHGVPQGGASMHLLTRRRPPSAPCSRGAGVQLEKPAPGAALWRFFRRTRGPRRRSAGAHGHRRVPRPPMELSLGSVGHLRWSGGSARALSVKVLCMWHVNDDNRGFCTSTSRHSTKSRTDRGAGLTLEQC